MPIKSYSPEIIVHPVLPEGAEPADVSGISKWLPRLHVLGKFPFFLAERAVIGPGLGRDAQVWDTVRMLFHEARSQRIPIVVDGVSYAQL
jgi:ATP-dependent NAD(P)H-hydrate dehydratase